MTDQLWNAAGDPMAYFQKAPTSLILPRTHEDEVMRLVADARLDPAEFAWAVRPSLYASAQLLISALIHTPTDSSFRFDFLESVLGLNRVSIYRPDDYCGQEQIKAAGSWEDQMQQVGQWLSRVAGAKR